MTLFGFPRESADYSKNCCCVVCCWYVLRCVGVCCVGGVCCFVPFPSLSLPHNKVISPSQVRALYYSECQGCGGGRCFNPAVLFVSTFGHLKTSPCLHIMVTSLTRIHPTCPFKLPGGIDVLPNLIKLTPVHRWTNLLLATERQLAESLIFRTAGVFKADNLI